MEKMEPSNRRTVSNMNRKPQNEPFHHENGLIRVTLFSRGNGNGDPFICWFAFVCPREFWSISPFGCRYRIYSQACLPFISFLFPSYSLLFPWVNLVLGRLVSQACLPSVFLLFPLVNFVLGCSLLSLPPCLPARLPSSSPLCLPYAPSVMLLFALWLMGLAATIQHPPHHQH